MSAAKTIVVARAAGIQLGIDDGDLVLEATAPPPAAVLDLLSRHKAEILELLRAERYAVVRYLNNHFQSSPLGQCARCGGGSLQRDPFVKLFVGDNRADIHTS